MEKQRKKIHQKCNNKSKTGIFSANDLKGLFSPQSKSRQNKNPNKNKNINYLEDSINNSNKLSSKAISINSDHHNSPINDDKELKYKKNHKFGTNIFQLYDRGKMYSLDRTILIGNVQPTNKISFTKKKKNQLEVISETIENDSLALNDPTNFYAGLFNRLKDKKSIIPKYP